MERQVKTKAIITRLLVIILLTISFIWGNSFKSIPESQSESQSVLEAIEPILEVFVGEGNVTENLVRKLAHFSEFALLGIEFILLLAVVRKLSLQNAVNCLFISLMVAIVDETIQVYSQRGSQVTDVILDFFGVLIGMLFATAFLIAMKHIRKQTQARNPD